MKLPIQQIFILVELLFHLSPFSGEEDISQQIILLHDSQYGFQVASDILALELQPHPTVAIGTKAVSSLFQNDFCKNGIFSGLQETMAKA